MRRVLCTFVAFWAIPVAAVWAQPDGEWEAEGRSMHELLAVMRNPPHVLDRCRAAEAIAVYGPAAVGPLCEFLRDDKVVIRSYAILALTRIGPQAQAAVPALVAAAADPVDPLRLRAVFALKMIGPGAAEAVPVLAEMLFEERHDLRQNAAEALAAIGDPAALQVLGDVFRKGDAELRLLAIQSLQATPGVVHDLMPLLLQAALDEDPEIADYAMVLVGGLGEAAVQPLITLLAADQIEARRRAAMALSQAGSAAAAAVPALTGALADSEPAVRFWAVKALGAIGYPARTAAPQLIACLQDPDPDVRWQAVRTVCRLELQTHAVGVLDVLRIDPHPAVRQVADRLLASRG